MSHCVGRVPRLKASDVGDLGGISRLKRSYEDLWIHGSPKGEELGEGDSYLDITRIEIALQVFWVILAQDARGFASQGI